MAVTSFPRPDHVPLHRSLNPSQLTVLDKILVFKVDLIQVRRTCL